MKVDKLLRVMELWLVWISLAVLGVLALSAALVFRAKLASIRNRLILVERELNLARVREERGNEKLNEIFNAVGALRSTLEILLERLQKKLDALTTLKS